MHRESSSRRAFVGLMVGILVALGLATPVVASTFAILLAGDGNDALDEAFRGAIGLASRDVFRKSIEVMEEALREGWGAEDVLAIRSWEVDRDIFESAVAEFMEGVGAGDVLVFYYAGHGSDYVINGESFNIDPWMLEDMLCDKAEKTILILDSCGSCSFSEIITSPDRLLIASVSAGAKGIMHGFLTGIQDVFGEAALPFTIALAESIRSGERSVLQAYENARLSWTALATQALAGKPCYYYDGEMDFVIPGNTADVSLDPEYQAIARQHLPTLLHQAGNVFFPTNACFDGDWDAKNNRHDYDRAVERGARPEPWTYVHILRNLDENKTYIQYWYYYVYNDYDPINIHNDDWELVVLVLDADYTPIEVKSGGHGALGALLGQGAAWRDAEKAMTPYENPNLHPIVFVDAGSHAGWVSAPWVDTPLWSGGVYTTWEAQASGRCMFLGHWYEDPEMESEGADGLDFGGDYVPWWEDGPSLSLEEQLSLEFLHDWVGMTFLPMKYGAPENATGPGHKGPGSPIVAPWRRDIWKAIDAATKTY